MLHGLYWSKAIHTLFSSVSGALQCSFKDTYQCNPWSMDFPGWFFVLYKDCMRRSTVIDQN